MSLTEAFNGVVRTSSIIANTHNLPVPHGQIIEACASGFGFRTAAAISQKLKGLDNSGRVTVPEFSPLRFVERLSALGSFASADSLAALLEGVKIHVAFERYEGERLASWQREGTTPYEIRVRVENVSKFSVVDPWFVLPDFSNSKGSFQESFRVDSAHQYRLPATYPVTRFHNRKDVMSVELLDGQWEGKLFAYRPMNGDEEKRMFARVRRALVQLIAPAYSTFVYFKAYRPDGMEHGCLRIEIDLAPALTAALGDGVIGLQAFEGWSILGDGKHISFHAGKASIVVTKTSESANIGSVKRGIFRALASTLESMQYEHLPLPDGELRTNDTADIVRLDGTILEMLTDEERHIVHHWQKVGRKYGIAVRLLKNVDPEKLARTSNAGEAAELIRLSSTSVSVWGPGLS